MTTVILTQSEIRRLLPMDTCMGLMALALETLGREQAVNPLRWGIRLPDQKAVLGMMPGAMRTPESIGLKVVGVFPSNHGTRFDSHQGVVLLLDPDNGVPLAILDAAEVTAIRTAAVSGVATRILAREDAGDLALLGSGVQARTHLEAMSHARKLRRVRVYSPTRAHREAFAARESGRFGVTVEPVDSAREAVLDADLICTVTSCKDPVLAGEWIAAGSHINAAGSSVASARELDTDAVARSRLFVDRRESAFNEAGDFLIPKQEGAFGDEHIRGEIGEILLGRIQGRSSDQEITLFKSLGLAVEDLASAHFLRAKALELGVGARVELGGVKAPD